MFLTYNLLKEDYGSIKTKNEEYIIINEVPYYDSIYKGHNKKEYYQAIAVKLGDELDEDGFTPAYRLRWNIIDETKIPPCDWTKPYEITENGFYQVLKGKLDE